MPALRRLFKSVPGPLYELRIGRRRWQRRSGALTAVSIKAAEQLNRRALDSLYTAGIVAVGSFKVAVLDDEWVPEIYQIVAGATRSDLERVFTPTRWTKNGAVTVWVKEVEHLGRSIREVLSHELKIWHHPCAAPSERRPKQAERTEYYEWLLALPVGARAIRFGCDRYYNYLKKPARDRVIKAKKRRPYPVWLSHHMFGQGRWWDLDPQCEHDCAKASGGRKKPVVRVRIVEPPADWYDESL
jgi:hypothetical protein